MTSLIKRFSQFVLRGRKQAVGVALLFAVVPMFGWVSIAVVALVTLCKGTMEGFLVLLWSALPYIVLASMNMWMPLLSSVVCGSLLVWLFAIVLRRYSSWRLLLELSTLLGVFAVLMTYLLFPDIHQWWGAHINNSIHRVANVLQLPLQMGRFDNAMSVVVQFATGIETMLIIFTALSELMIGRAMQSKVFAPNCWRSEWLNFRVSYISSAALLVFLVLAWFNFNMTRDLLPILLLPFLLVGVSVVHSVLEARRKSVNILLLFYLLLMLVAVTVPSALGVLVVVAMLDSVFNFRLRFSVRRV